MTNIQYHLLARWLPRMLKVIRSTPGTCCTDSYCARWAQGYSPWGWGLTATQFDLPSLTPLSVAGCGRLQLGVAHLATSVALLQVVNIWPAQAAVVESPLRDSWLNETLPFFYSPLRDSWLNETLPFFTVNMFTEFIFWWNFSQVWTFWVLM